MNVRRDSDWLTSCCVLPMRAVVDGLLSVVLAPSCAACTQPLSRPSTSIVCDPCWRAIRVIVPPYCEVCGDPLRSCRAQVEGGRCARCVVARSHISIGRSIGEYDGSLRGILHALKYDRRTSIAAGLHALMRIHGHDAIAGADVAVPVPLHWRRRWSRGFNQAAALAGGLGLPVVHALRRTRPTRSQTDLPADRRRANVRDAFAIRRRLRKGAVVVLVDDVSTTGATLDACAKVLIEAGAAEVRTLTAARVVTKRPGALPP